MLGPHCTLYNRKSTAAGGEPEAQGSNDRRDNVQRERESDGEERSMNVISQTDMHRLSEQNKKTKLLSLPARRLHPGWRQQNTDCRLRRLFGGDTAAICVLKNHYA